MTLCYLPHLRPMSGDWIGSTSVFHWLYRRGHRNSLHHDAPWCIKCIASGKPVPNSRSCLWTEMLRSLFLWFRVSLRCEDLIDSAQKTSDCISFGARLSMLSMLSRLNVFFFNLWGPWVMGHGSCWGPNIFFLGAYGIREVEVWWCSGTGEPGEPGGTWGALGTWDRCRGADSGFPIWQVHRKELQAGVDTEVNFLKVGSWQILRSKSSNNLQRIDTAMFPLL